MTLLLQSAATNVLKISTRRLVRWWGFNLTSIICHTFYVLCHVITLIEATKAAQKFVRLSSLWWHHADHRESKKQPHKEFYTPDKGFVIEFWKSFTIFDDGCGKFACTLQKFLGTKLDSDAEWEMYRCSHVTVNKCSRVVKRRPKCYWWTQISLLIFVLCAHKQIERFIRVSPVREHFTIDVRALLRLITNPSRNYFFNSKTSGPGFKKDLHYKAGKIKA